MAVAARNSPRHLGARRDRPPASARGPVRESSVRGLRPWRQAPRRFRARRPSASNARATARRRAPPDRPARRAAVCLEARAAQMPRGKREGNAQTERHDIRAPAMEFVSSALPKSDRHGRFGKMPTSRMWGMATHAQVANTVQFPQLGRVPPAFNSGDRATGSLGNAGAAACASKPFRRKAREWLRANHHGREDRSSFSQRLPACR